MFSLVFLSVSYAAVAKDVLDKKGILDLLEQEKIWRCTAIKNATQGRKLFSPTIKIKGGDCDANIFYNEICVKDFGYQALEEKELYSDAYSAESFKADSGYSASYKMEGEDFVTTHAHAAKKNQLKKDSISAADEFERRILKGTLTRGVAKVLRRKKYRSSIWQSPGSSPSEQEVFFDESYECKCDAAVRKLGIKPIIVYEEGYSSYNGCAVRHWLPYISYIAPRDTEKRIKDIGNVPCKIIKRLQNSEQLVVKQKVQDAPPVLPIHRTFQINSNSPELVVAKSKEIGNAAYYELYSPGEVNKYIDDVWKF